MTADMPPERDDRCTSVCMIDYTPRLCTKREGHDGPHTTRDGFAWNDDASGAARATIR